MTVKFSGAGRTRPFIRDQSFLMRIVAGDARDPTFLIEGQNDVEPGLHLRNLRRYLIGRFAQVSLVQRLLGRFVVTSNANRSVVADKLYVFGSGFFLVRHFRVTIKAFFFHDLPTGIQLLVGIILRVFAFIVASEADIDFAAVRRSP